MNIDSGWSQDFIWCTLCLGGLIDESVPYGRCALVLLLLELAMSLGGITELRLGSQRALGQDAGGASGGCGYV